MDDCSYVNERIRNLLTSTNLTFKQIVEQLKYENLPISFNTIRRVNKDNRYRKPRYYAKLTPQQREELLLELINTSKPNLSSLARQYGVCHGSVWYWWDKISKLRARNNNAQPNDEPILDFDELFEPDDIFGDNIETAVTPDLNESYVEEENMNNYTEDGEARPLNLVSRKISKDKGEDQKSLELDVSDRNLKIVGRVQAKATDGHFVDLPIVMYTLKQS